MFSVLLTAIPVPAWLIIVIMLGILFLLHKLEGLLNCTMALLKDEYDRDH